MNKEQIKTILPHREPMLLIDSVELADDGCAIGTYTVTGDEYFVQGHFPGNPVVPGVILCEMMAQTCCVLFAEEVANATPYFTGLDKVKIKHTVRPGDTIRFECTLTRSRGMFHFASGKGFVQDQGKPKLAIKGDFSFALVPDEAKEGE